MNVLQVVQQGQELAAGIAEAAEVMAGGAEGAEGAPLDAQARVQLLLEFLHDRQLDLEELAEERRARFEQCVQLGTMRALSTHRIYHKRVQIKLSLK